ncbi:EF-hand domain [Macleaya cordata]|uniref:EF-hand domain n=1 Tax=Macleaya cordata TaxID=56857 RepID=A0A200QWT2_MACCD|nr:EF-hand domain [Macleaya cordata]
MEKPLLGGGSGGGGGGESSSRTTVENRRWPTLPFQGRRSSAIAYGDPYQKAAALVDLAEDGIGLPEQVLDDSRFETAAKFYFIFIRFNFLWSLNLFALIALNFLEKPLWCGKYSTHTCSDREYFFLGQLPYLTKAESLVYEVITLFILILHTFFPIAYEGYQLFSKNPLNKLKVISLLILVADLLVYALYLSPVPINSLPLRIAPYIRVVFVILNIRDLRACVVTVGGMLGTYLNVLALSLLFLLFSSWLAYVIFEDTKQGKTTFYSYGVTLYQMFVLFTTSNNPDVWIPAYKESRWNSLFFVIYVLLGVYFLTNLILAVVYDSFKAQLAKQVAERDLMRKRILCKAFNLIDKYKNGFLHKDQCIRLFEELNKYRSLPKISGEEFELIFHELDDSGDFKINLDEFADLCNAIGLRFKKEAIPSCFENYPSFYRSYFSERLKDFVRSPTFGYIIAFILMLNLVAVVIETTLDIENNSGQKVWQEVEFIFGWIYVLEMALKIYSYGFENYWTEGQNRFDFVVTWIIVIGETATFAFPDVPFLSNGEWIRYLLIARMLRLIRLLMHVQRYRAFVATFLTLIPTLMPYLGTIFCILCIYCSLGLQIFGGIVNSGNPKLEESALYENDYLLFNFNDYPNGMVTLFNLLVMGNWQVWMQGYKELTGTSWTLVYFISFYLITVLLLLNLVVAFVLEAFFAEIDLDKSSESEDGNKGEGSGRRRSVGSKTRSQRVDILLHRILSAELNESQPQDSNA